MLKVLVPLCVIVVFGVVAGLVLVGREDVFMNGPLQDGHRYMVDRQLLTAQHHCKHCHTPFWGASEPSKCLRCHYEAGKTPGKSALVDNFKCLGCHLEHSRGKDPLVPRSERSCRGCHPGAEESHRAKTYIAEQGIDLKSCLNASGCHLEEFHDKHRYTPPPIDFASIHDKASATYDEKRCGDCHGEVRERKDRYKAAFYGFPASVRQEQLRAWMLEGRTEGKTFMHRVHIARMDMKCGDKGCHALAAARPKAPTVSPMGVDKMGCCGCHASVNTPPRMWCTGPMRPM